MNDYRDSIVAYMRNGTLHYLASKDDDTTTSNIDNAYLFAGWQAALDAVFSRGYKQGISGWFVFTKYEGEWRLRRYDCQEDWLEAFYEDHKNHADEAEEA